MESFIVIVIFGFLVALWNQLSYIVGRKDGISWAFSRMKLYYRAQDSVRKMAELKNQKFTEVELNEQAIIKFYQLLQLEENDEN